MLQIREESIRSMRFADLKLGMERDFKGEEGRASAPSMALAALAPPGASGLNFSYPLSKNNKKTAAPESFLSPRPFFVPVYVLFK